jgi:hypothetical protein
MQPVHEDSLEYLRKKIREMMNDRADFVATGAAEDWAAYRYQVGVIEGLARAERELLDLAEKLSEQN